MNAVTLTQELLKFNTINPPGNEAEVAEYIGEILKANGFGVEYIPHAENRLNLIATKGLSNSIPPIVLTGHLDVVPLGAKQWTVDPFESKIIDGKLYGRGSSDMKSGISAMIVAAIESFENYNPVGGVKLIFTADEELGCNGALKLEQSGYNLGNASAILVGEPTCNYPLIGHKGGLYMNAVTNGITAHSSMPELGDNAIYKAARAITKIENYEFDVEKDELLGMPTINVGKINGGLNLNSVPDRNVFTIDVRSTTKINNDEVLKRLRKLLGKEVTIDPIVNHNAIASNSNDPFVSLVNKICGNYFDISVEPKSATYLTDASVLKPLMNNPPTIILGPGELTMAHQTDEYCYIENIENAVKIYKEIILKNGEETSE